MILRENSVDQMPTCSANEVGERVKCVRNTWQKTRDAAGFKGLQLRDLRHESGSRFDDAGVPTNYVSKINEGNSAPAVVPKSEQ